MADDSATTQPSVTAVGGLTDDALLALCRTTRDEDSFGRTLLDDLRYSSCLLGEAPDHDAAEIAAAMILLASALAELPGIGLSLECDDGVYRAVRKRAFTEIAVRIAGYRWDKADASVVNGGLNRGLDECEASRSLVLYSRGVEVPGTPDLVVESKVVCIDPSSLSVARVRGQERLGAMSQRSIVSQDAVAGLLGALAGLRLAVAHLLNSSESPDPFPRSQVDAFRMALDTAHTAAMKVSRANPILSGGLDDVGYMTSEVIRGVAHAVKDLIAGMDESYENTAFVGMRKWLAWKAIDDVIPIESRLLSAPSDTLKFRVPEEDRRISGLSVLAMLAETYHEIIEAIRLQSDSVIVSTSDLDDSYLWVTTSLAHLLDSHEDLQDFPKTFQPILPALTGGPFAAYMRASPRPSASDFLAVVRRYIADKGFHEPDPSSIASAVVERFRPNVGIALQRVEHYRSRLREIEAAGRLDQIPLTGGKISHGASDRAGNQLVSEGRSIKPCGDSIDDGKKAAVVLNCISEPCCVLGSNKDALTACEYKVVKALLDAGENGLTKDQLERVVPSARRILRRLKEDADWDEVIRMPRRSNRRYRILA